ncbi:hypothetical protein K1X76_07025 [bacterium]|nr:hypothetical protein [bacterium]
MISSILWPWACEEMPTKDTGISGADSPISDTDVPLDTDQKDDSGSDTSINSSDTASFEDVFYVATPLDAAHASIQGQDPYLRLSQSGTHPLYTNLNAGVAAAANDNTLIVGASSYDDFGYFTKLPSDDCTAIQTQINHKKLSIRAENGSVVIWPMCETNPLVPHLVFSDSEISMNNFEFYRNDASAVKIVGGSTYFSNINFSQIEAPGNIANVEAQSALDVNGASVSLTESTFANNVASQGSAIKAVQSNVIATDVNFMNNGSSPRTNHDPTWGGAVYLENSQFTYNSGTVAQNLAEQGASFYVGQNSHLEVGLGVALSNTAGSHGAAQISVAESGASVTIKPASGDAWTVEVGLDFDGDGLTDAYESVETDPTATTTCEYGVGCY